MTQGTPSDRALAALLTSGMNESPLASLEREDALFVLTDSTLLYQDGGGTRRVTLRDLTRIHSDQEGMLRVETPAGTALTASLLGFEPAQVQHFFKEVRTATGAAKNLPASPLPTAGGAKTFGPAPVSTPAPTPAPAPIAAATPAPAAPTTLPASAVTPEVSRENSPRFVEQADLPTAPPVVIGETPAAPQAARAPEPVPPAERPVNPSAAREPMVISSSGYSPGSGKSVPGTPASQPSAEKPASLTAPEPPREKSSADVFREKADATPIRTMDAPQAPPVQAPTTPVPTALTPTAPATLGTGGQERLAVTRQAEVVEALVGRLRLLGGVLFVAAVALAYFQFSADSRLNALWTLLAGGVGSIALLALADLAKLLAALARTSSAGSGVMDVD